MIICCLTKKEAGLGFMPRAAFDIELLGKFRGVEMFSSPVTSEASSSSRAFQKVFDVNMRDVREGREKWFDTLKIF